jgi:hypothetical protein
MKTRFRAHSNRGPRYRENSPAHKRDMELVFQQTTEIAFGARGMGKTGLADWTEQSAMVLTRFDKDDRSGIQNSNWEILGWAAFPIREALRLPMNQRI